MSRVSHWFLLMQKMLLPTVPVDFIDFLFFYCCSQGCLAHFHHNVHHVVTILLSLSHLTLLLLFPGKVAT